MRRKCLAIRWVFSVIGVALLLVGSWTSAMAVPRYGEISSAISKKIAAPCSNNTLHLTVSPCDPNATVYTGTTDTTAFLINNNSNTTQTVSIGVTCTGVVVSCSVVSSPLTVPFGDNASFNVIWTVGASAGSGTIQIGTSSMISTIHVTANQSDFTIDTTKTYRIDQQLSLCALNCFAGTTSYNTVPFFTRDKPRSLALVYQEDRAHPRPIITADVSLVGTSVAPSQYQISATLNGVAVTFSNGDTKSYFSGSPNLVRLAQSFDASGFSTGIDTLVVTVGAVFAGTTVQHSYTQIIAIVNESASPIAAGWTISGWQRLYVTGGGYLITDGTGDAVFFPALGVRAADYTTLSYDAGTSRYIRTALDSTRAYFSATGVLTQVVGHVGDTTRYFATGARLDSIFDPQRVAQGNGTYWALSYGTGGTGLVSISEVGGAGRVTAITRNGDGTLATIADPDSVLTRFGYDSNKRLTTIINRRGDTTNFQYNTTTGKLTELDQARIAVDAGGGSTTTTRPAITYTPWMTRGVPNAATSSSSLATPILASGVTGTVTDPGLSPQS